MSDKSPTQAQPTKSDARSEAQLPAVVVEMLGLKLFGKPPKRQRDILDETP